MSIHYDEDESEWVGGSGARTYGHTDVLGIGECDICVGTMNLYYGADGGFASEVFTLAERLELADIMIARWQVWKEQQK